MLPGGWTTSRRRGNSGVTESPGAPSNVSRIVKKMQLF